MTAKANYNTTGSAAPFDRPQWRMRLYHRLIHFGAPADPDLKGAGDADHRQQRQEQHDADFDRPMGRTRPTGTV